MSYKKIGNVTLLPDWRGRPNFQSDPDFDFANKIFIYASFIPNPRLNPMHNDAEKWIAYHDEQNIDLFTLGVIDLGVLLETEYVWGVVEFAREFDDLESAQRVFQQMKESKSGLADFYLYNKGKLIDKYD